MCVCTYTRTGPGETIRLWSPVWNVEIFWVLEHTLQFINCAWHLALCLAFSMHAFHKLYTNGTTTYLVLKV